MTQRLKAFSETGGLVYWVNAADTERSELAALGLLERNPDVAYVEVTGGNGRSTYFREDLTPDPNEDQSEPRDPGEWD